MMMIFVLVILMTGAADADPSGDGEQTAMPTENGVSMDVAHPVLGGWIHPVVASEEVIPTRDQRKFGARRKGRGRQRTGCGRHQHCGVDLSGPRGRTIVAVADGVVVHIERRRNGKDGKSGRYVRLAHAGGVFTSYMHLDAIAPGLSVGDKVKAGDFIGRLGRSGIRHSAPHLHFNLELDVGNDTVELIDPTPYLERAKVIDDPAPQRQRGANNS